MPFDLGLWPSLWLALVIFGAAWVRGYSGFGFAALIVAGSGLVTDPFHFVPVVILSDIVLTATQLRGIWRQIDWRRVAGLALGALVGVPLGVQLLPGLGIDLGRAVISLFILAMCGLLLRGWHLSRRPGAAADAGVGFVSGLANGAAVGGLPVAAYFAAQPIPAAAFRATIIGYFTLLDLWTLPNMVYAGLVTRDTLLATGLFLPLMLGGLALGSRRFLSASPQSFRRFAIALLVGLALMGLLRSLF
jgi:uncharacterized membrane protein YfcA